MNTILVLAFLFYIGSIVGWILELFFRKIVCSEHKWINPGFLTGPYLPLYGFGTIVLFFISLLEKYIFIENIVLKRVLLFVLMALVMTLLEYVAGLIFVKNMKIKLWDYSKEKFNIQGIICPKYSFLWSVLGALYYFLIHPKIINAIIWLSENLAFSFFVGMFYGFFVIDVVYSLNLMVKIKKFAKENEFIVKFEELKAGIIQNAKSRKKKFKFIISIGADGQIHEHLKGYYEKIEKEIKKRIGK